MLRRILIFSGWFLLGSGYLAGQSNPVVPGISDRSPALDPLPGFINPPPGYGDVPFYWWQGDTLTKERLEWQLNALQNKGITSLQINYSHLDEGGLLWGLSNPSKPALFTPEWWDLVRWFAVEAGKRGMSISLSDYTLGIGQGFSMDEAIAENPELNGSVLKSLLQTLTGKGRLKLPSNLLHLSAIRLHADSSLEVNTRRDLLDQVQQGVLTYDFGDEQWQVCGVYFETLAPSYDPMHPQSGAAYTHHFFGKFERELPRENHNALNFFFSDELNFRVDGNLWNAYFADAFQKRKGYDVVPFLDALYRDIGAITPKIKLDYNDVLVGLSEAHFFQPVYEWHQARGLIYGCDHGGRGKDVVEFGDYFRTQRWNQGPGSDQPRLSKELIKAKVAASIAHLYERPRVWLEGFYGSGWGTSSAGLTDAIFANYAMGYNLLSLHGLYYSTQGGWWEWAPPCNHFHMPYWEQIDPLMTCVQRLSYLLSQGDHQCDVAVIYPTEPMVAGMDGAASVHTAFETGSALYKNGIDFDFLDYESLARADVKNGELHVAGERFRVLVIPSMKAIRQASLEKIEAFKRAGGMVVHLGAIPEATERNGRFDPETAKWVAGLFAPTAHFLHCANPDEVPQAISEKYIPNFRILSNIVGQPYFMHRVIGNRPVFALYNIPKGTRCFFRAKGRPELWNPWTGEVSSLSSVSTPVAEGTEIILPLSETEMQLIVFRPENETASSTSVPADKVLRQQPLGQVWEFELNPSLDNRWGDFQLPATNGFMGAQVRKLYFKETPSGSSRKVVIDSTWEKLTCSYGAQFLKLGPLPALPSETELSVLAPKNPGDGVSISGETHRWEEYGFSWQLGVEGDYGHQGYHGLKGAMYDAFIRLGRLVEDKHSLKRAPEAEGNFYLLYSAIIAPEEGTYDLLLGNVKPHQIWVNGQKISVDAASVFLKKGANPILIAYDQACETYLVARKTQVPAPEKAQVAMRWFGDLGVLPFDYRGANPSAGLMAFQSAPGLQSLRFSAYGKVRVWVDAKPQKLLPGATKPDGLTEYSVRLARVNPSSVQVLLQLAFAPGYRGMGALPSFIEQQCGKGTLPLGDWSELDGLNAYSGGAIYRSAIDLPPGEADRRLQLDLGDLVSSAEVRVNGKSAGIRVAPPWTYDITSLAQEGNNRIEILLFNTLANNYTTIPTRYRGSIKSGLIGPVTLKVLEK